MIEENFPFSRNIDSSFQESCQWCVYFVGELSTPAETVLTAVFSPHLRLSNNDSRGQLGTRRHLPLPDAGSNKCRYRTILPDPEPAHEESTPGFYGSSEDRTNGSY